MKFTAVEDISSPIDLVWERLADIEGFEAKVRPHIEDIQRRPPGPAGHGTVWTAYASVMGKRREVTVTLTEMQPPHRMAARARIEGIEIGIDIVLTVVSDHMTRLTVTTEATAQGIAGKLLLKTAEMARDRLGGRYAKQVSGLAKRIGKDPKLG